MNSDIARCIATLGLALTPLLSSAQKRLHYIALELDEASRRRVVEYAETNLPWEEANIIAHHMTILHHTGLRTTLDDPMMAQKDYILAWALNHEGESFELCATEVGYSDKAFALLVTDTPVPSRNRQKHITLATNPATSGSAVDSNAITYWQALPTPMLLTGTVTVYYK